MFCFQNANEGAVCDFDFLLSSSILPSHAGAGSNAVRVAVRCRPSNSREKALASPCIISMNGPETVITNPVTGQAKNFTFDYSYWSHDLHGASYASQQTVFDDLGRDVLENAWNGYNVCLFAYGQTGSGKSYSMVGYGDEEGIVPRAGLLLLGGGSLFTFKHSRSLLTSLTSRSNRCLTLSYFVVYFVVTLSHTTSSKSLTRACAFLFTLTCKVYDVEEYLIEMDADGTGFA